MDLLRNIDHNDFYRKTTINDKILFILNYGLLAPSTHNSQPWKFKIISNILEIYIDEDVSIREVDPKGRDLYISIGCLIENLLIAASTFKCFDKIEYILEEKNNLVARIYFRDDHEGKDFLSKEDVPILNSILTRKNVRGKFIEKKVGPKDIEKVCSLNNFPSIDIEVISDLKTIKKLAEITRKALISAYKKNSFRLEMSKWFRANTSSRKDGLHGYALGMSLIPSLIFPLLVKFFDVGPLVSRLNYASFITSPNVFVISTSKNDKSEWINVGRLAERSMLELNLSGVKTSIYVAAIEIDSYDQEVSKLLGRGRTPQFLFCAGYMREQNRYTPRYSLNDRLMESV